MTINSPLALGLVALVLTACAMALGDLPPRMDAERPAASVEGRAGATPVACAFTVRDTGGGVAYEARIETTAASSGHYELRIRGGGASIDQSGDFSAGAGEALLLGEATLSGRASDYDATLALTLDGRRVICPLVPAGAVR